MSRRVTYVCIEYSFEYGTVTHLRFGLRELGR